MALETYREGLGELPVRTTPLALSGKGKEKAVAEDAVKEEVKEEEKEEDEEEKDMVELSELRSVLSANVGACLLKLVRRAVAFSPHSTCL